MFCHASLFWGLLVGRVRCYLLVRLFEVSGFDERLMVLEACITSAADAVVAVQNGAQRLELNVAIEVGGLTPTVGLLRQVKEAVNAPVLVMIRPRSGGFCYSGSEKHLMMRDARELVDCGADGIVVGGLAAGGVIDRQLIESLRDVCGQGEVVFHRAFDLLHKQNEMLEELIELRVDRVLTSGCAATALEGADCISELRKSASGRIEILPAGGIRAKTVVEVLENTGCNQVHGTFKMLQTDPAGCVCSGSYPVVDGKEVSAVRALMDGYPAMQHRP